MTDGIEDYDYSGVGEQVTSLTAPLNMSDLIAGKGCKFAVERSRFFYDEQGSDDDDYGSGRKKRVEPVKVYEDPELVMPEIGEDEIFLKAPIIDYNGLEAKMESIHESGFVKKLVLRKGNTISVKEDGKVVIHYAAFSQGKSEPYDATQMAGKSSPVSLCVMAGEMIVGLQIGLRTMCVGEISQFMIYPEFAYGEMGCPPRILPGAKVVYAVEVVAVKSKEMLGDISYMSADERAQLPFDDVMKASLALKARGSGNYLDRDFFGAMKLYSRSIAFLEDYPTANEADNKRRDEELPEIYCNKAQCWLRLEAPAKACVACKNGLHIPADPVTRAKLLIRFAEAKYRLNGFEEALKYCREAMDIFDENEILEEKHTKLHQNIEDALIEQKNQEKFLCQKMFGASLNPTRPASAGGPSKGKPSQ